MRAVLRNLSSIITRHCQISVVAAQHWDTPSPLDKYCFFELKFCRDYLRCVNARDVLYCNPPFISVYSDASDFAYGGHVLGKDIFAHKMFTSVERTQSSTYRGLAAIQFVLDAFCPLFFPFPGKMVYRQPRSGQNCAGR